MAYATIEQVAKALNTRVTPENTAGLQSCVDAAAFEIDSYADRDRAALVASSWLFNEATGAADPGAGYLAREGPAAAATNALYIDSLDAAGVDQTAALLTLAQGDQVATGSATETRLRDLYTVTGTPLDRVGWVELPVQLQTAAGFDPVEGDDVAFVADRVPPLPPGQLSLAERENILRGVEWAKANEYPYGFAGFEETGVLMAPKDTFGRHAAALHPLKQHWGVA
jgi:hypothetical protein